MNKNKVTHAIVLFTKRAKNDGSFPLKLRITYKQEQKYYGVGWDFDIETWGKISNQNARGEYRNIKLKLNEIENKAKQVIDYIDNAEEQFSFHRFKELFFNQDNNTDYVLEAFRANISSLKEQGRVSSAESVACALKSFETFFKNKQIRFIDITPQVLSKYENWMIKEQHNSISTAGIYLRSMRVLFNQQIAKGFIEIDKYPFGKYKYQIPSVEVRNKSISKEVLKKIYDYQPEPFTNEDKAKDLWFFLYLSNGMNVKDMCRLKYSSFKDGYFLFTRAKTDIANKQKREISVVLNEELLRIIGKWGNKFNGIEDAYIFPFYPQNVTAEIEYKITHSLTKVINSNINKLVKKLGLDIHITTYSARQTFSNVLLNSDAPIKLISDSLGHANSAITEKHYLKTVALEKQKLYNNELLNFDK